MEASFLVDWTDGERSRKAALRSVGKSRRTESWKVKTGKELRNEPSKPELSSSLWQTVNFPF